MKNKAQIILVLLFIILTALRLFFILVPGQENSNALVWGSMYQIIALWGACCGFYLSKHWGGSKSVIGRVNLAFALGLLAQCFGQTVYSYYFYTGGEVLYPSIGDIGFFGSVLLYIYGAILLARVSGVKASLKSLYGKLQILLIPAALLLLSYFVFLKGYVVDWGNPLRVFLDFGYPLGQAIYVSIALLTLTTTRNVLGGLMRKPIVFFLVALLIQYFSDYTFLYQSSRGTYVAGGMVDFMYFASYFAMALSLTVLASSFEKIKNT